MAIVIILLIIIVIILLFGSDGFWVLLGALLKFAFVLFIIGLIFIILIGISA